MNLTAITEPEAVETLHFLDSLTAAAVLPPDTLANGRVLDVGSGAGFRACRCASPTPASG